MLHIQYRRCFVEEFILKKGISQEDIPQEGACPRSLSHYARLHPTVDQLAQRRFLYMSSSYKS